MQDSTTLKYFLRPIYFALVVIVAMNCQESPSSPEEHLWSSSSLSHSSSKELSSSFSSSIEKPQSSTLPLSSTKSSSSSFVSSSSSHPEASSSSGFSSSLSSSSQLKSSSSLNVSSSLRSSSSDWPPFNHAFSYGEITDPRNNRTYKTIVIGSQTWMAENLKYGEIGTTLFMPYIYGERYGGLYSWKIAMDLPYSCYENYCEDSIKVNHQGICPENWHIPSDLEWLTLSDYVDAHNGDEEVGTSLKASRGWSFRDEVIEASGTDRFGFSAIPGHEPEDGRFHVCFWSSTEEYVYNGQKTYSTRAYCWFLGGSYSNFGYGSISKDELISVRCIKNAE